MPTFAPRHLAVAAASLGLALSAAMPAATAGAAPARPAAAPITVQVTVNGPDSTLFSGNVSTTGHDLTTASGGTHRCDGTNGGANPSPGATPTAALDDAASGGGFTWDGTWSTSFDDFLVTAIAGDSQTADDFWEVSVNGTALSVGGCQYELSAGDQVAFTWTAI